MNTAIAVFALQQQQAASPDYNSNLLQYGAIGAMLVAVLFLSAIGVLYWKPSVDWLREQIKQLQGLNADLLETNQKAVPALGEAVAAIRAMSEALKDLRTELANLRTELTSLREENVRMREEIRELNRK